MCQLGCLVVLDGLGYGRTAHLALERALVMIRLLGPEAEPHGHRAPIALWVLDFLEM